jgi:hypothetical protein
MSYQKVHHPHQETDGSFKNKCLNRQLWNLVQWFDASHTS